MENDLLCRAEVPCRCGDHVWLCGEAAMPPVHDVGSARFEHFFKPPRRSISEWLAWFLFR